MAEEMAVRARGVSKRFHRGQADEVIVLDQVTFEISQGQHVAVVGPSGAGKSTLLYIVGALLHPSEGDVVVNGHVLSQCGDEQLAVLRSEHVGFVFQFHHLLPELSAMENVAVPGLMRRRDQVPRSGGKALAGRRTRTMNRADIFERASGLLRELDMGHRLHHRPQELSGGEQQRVAIARALMNEPQLVLADEPTGNLDRDRGRAVWEQLRAACHTRGAAMMVVTHDEEVGGQCHRVLHLENGTLK